VAKPCLTWANFQIVIRSLQHGFQNELASPSAVVADVMRASVNPPEHLRRYKDEREVISWKGSKVCLLTLKPGGRGTPRKIG